VVAARRRCETEFRVRRNCFCIEKNWVSGAAPLPLLIPQIVVFRRRKTHELLIAVFADSNCIRKPGGSRSVGDSRRVDDEVGARRPPSEK